MVKNSLGPLHWTQLSFASPWAVSCMDLLGPFRTRPFRGARATRNNAQVLDSHVLIIVCKVSKLISAQVMDGKNIEGLSSAFTMHCSLHGVPTFLGIDADPAQTLLLSQSEVCFPLRNHLSKEYGIEHEVAPTVENFHQGGVEVRMKAFKRLAGYLDLTRSNVTPLALQSFVAQVAAILNLTP